MASLDRCTALLEEKGDTLFEEFAGRLEAFRKKAEQWNSIQVPGKELIGRNGVFDLDRSKLVLSVKGVCSGEELSSRLREEYHLEMEMDAAGYALALTSFLDTEEGFERLAEALTQIDKELHEMQQSRYKKKCTTKIWMNGSKRQENSGCCRKTVGKQRERPDSGLCI